MKKIKVAFVEDDKDWIKVITSFLKRYDDIEVVGTASSKSDCLEMVKTHDFDILIVDINLNGHLQDGIYVVLESLEIKKIKIIMLSSLKDEQTIKDAFTAGAVDYIIKDNFNDLPYIIRRVYNSHIPSEIMLKEFQRLKREEQLKDLTPSERDLFQYIQNGYSIKQIETTLYKSENTLKQQIRSILKKLNVKSRFDAIKKVDSGGVLKGSKLPADNDSP